MTQLKIATYNINSVRLRINRVLDFLHNDNIDVLCLQETKVEDHLFPKDAFINAGYTHLYYNGEKSYNGVAIISRIPLHTPDKQFFYNDHARHISAILPDGTHIHNFYIPAGGDEPDTEINPKFLHKLSYLACMKAFFKEHHTTSSPLIMVGDFNIAPFEHDVWSHKQLLKVVSHTPIEVETLADLQNDLQWIDVAREFVPESEKLYSWWSYRSKDWRKGNRGRRLDHIWATPPLKDKITDFSIYSDLRDGEKPSDHVPVCIHYRIDNA